MTWQYLSAFRFQLYVRAVMAYHSCPGLHRMVHCCSLQDIHIAIHRTITKYSFQLSTMFIYVKTVDAIKVRAVMTYHRCPGLHGMVHCCSLEGIHIAIHSGHQQVQAAIVVQVICQHHAV